MVDGRKCSRDLLKSVLTRKLVTARENPDYFVDEMSRLLLDAHDFQMSTRKIVNGEMFINY